MEKARLYTSRAKAETAMVDAWRQWDFFAIKERGDFGYPIRTSARAEKYERKFIMAAASVAFFIRQEKKYIEDQA